MSLEEIRGELAELRAAMGQLAQARVFKETEWSAHANWKNKSRNLLGDYDFSSRFSVPEGVEMPALLENVINDSSNERFLQVANSLAKLLKE